jgi:hypothetical protein
MPETPFAPAPVTGDRTAGHRRHLIIDAALDYMSHRDWYYAEDDDDPEVLAQLERLYAADLQPTPCSGSLLFDIGVTLALLWADERRAEYERALPTWSCDCGAVYKRDMWAAQHEVIYTVTPDGLFDDLVASTRGKRGIAAIPRDAYAMNNGGCPSCRRAFKSTIARQADPQTSLIL